MNRAIRRVLHMGCGETLFSMSLRLERKGDGATRQVRSVHARRLERGGRRQIR